MPTAPVRDIEMAYDAAGPAGGLPILLVHGLGNSSLVWQGAAAGLAAAGHRAVTGDCRGHGATSKPDGPYAIEQMADDWAALHAHLGLAPAHWVGSSMGGAIAMAAALRHPARVSSLVLVDTWPKTDAAFAAVLAERLRVLGTEGIDAYARLAYPQAFGEAHRAAHPEAYEGYRARVAQTDQRALALAVAALERHDLLARLPEIRVPTTVMVGEADTLLPPRHSETIAARVPGARLVRFPGVGHLPMLEAPDAFLREMLDHLRRVTT
jgi:pimeloyl-ACP methyl ester carboxylesterase